MTGPEQHDPQYDPRHEERLGQQVGRGLAGVAARVRVPVVLPDDDVARGRRRVRRHRLAGAAAGVAAVAVVAGAAAAAPALLHADAGPGYSGRSHAPSTSRSATVTPKDGPKRVVLKPSDGPPFPFAMDPSPKDTDRTLATWQRVLAEHLDPRWQHLVKYDARTNGNVQTGSDGSVITSLGSKYGWQVAGESGLGMLQVSVDAGWKELLWDCDVPSAGWQCHAARGPGGEDAKVARHDGVLEVAVEHADGEVVVLSADSLFGNNSTVAVSGMAVSEHGLLEAAADERLALPGGAREMPPPVSASLLEQVGRELLSAPGEPLRHVQGGGGTSAWMQADWAGEDGARGRLDWSVVPSAGHRGNGYSCTSQFTRCVLEPVDARRVFVGHVVARGGGGWEVAYAGPSYTAVVSFRPQGRGSRFPLQRAEALVLDDRLQPTG